MRALQAIPSVNLPPQFCLTAPSVLVTNTDNQFIHENDVSFQPNSTNGMQFFSDYFQVPLQCGVTPPTCVFNVPFFWRHFLSTLPNYVFFLRSPAAELLPRSTLLGQEGRI